MNILTSSPLRAQDAISNPMFLFIVKNFKQAWQEESMVVRERWSDNFIATHALSLEPSRYQPMMSYSW